jgi:redox-sensitive bicupin YhaK (pirin superfamily)
MLDPFLLFDMFASNQAQDYIGGFPSHPHRGFETVTYMLDGRMRHKDNAGNEGVLSAHGVQWMTAGRGIIHSEMPEQSSGLLKGFQLWVNLPQKNKMVEPSYQEFPADQVAIEKHEDGTLIKVISGSTDNGTIGPVVNHYVKPTYMHITLPENVTFEQQLPQSDNTFIFVVSGELYLNAYQQQQQQKVTANQLAVLTSGKQVKITANSQTELLLVSGQPLNEPVARGGPFVMNTKAEIMQAFSDLQNNRF